MKKTLIALSLLAAAPALEAQPAGGFGGFQMPRVEVHCSEKFADIDYADLAVLLLSALALFTSSFIGKKKQIDRLDGVLFLLLGAAYFVYLFTHL